ncbi:MAG: NAD(P)H-dependent oxidoreductase [Crocinitomicaceae bacterium]
MRLIESLNWRYATKKFDDSKQVDSKDIEVLKESIRLAATSYGLQPFKVKIVRDAELKEKLKSVSFNQSQILESSHVFVFAHLTKVKPSFIDDYINLCASERQLNLNDLIGYSNFMKTTISNLTDDEVHQWASKQAYIGMTNLLTACAEMRIDACPIEGFESGKYNEILDLTSKDLSACVVVAVGYRATDDSNQHLKKVRLATEDLFI